MLKGSPGMGACALCLSRSCMKGHSCAAYGAFNASGMVSVWHVRLDDVCWHDVRIKLLGRCQSCRAKCKDSPCKM